MAGFQDTHFALLDLKYEYLEDGYKLIAYTDVPCHLYCRMTLTPPRKHVLPSPRRGTYLTGDVRFCFVVYEDNEQDEAGDTLIHTFYKHPWPYCQHRWFYFVATQGTTTSVSETCIFHFHFPAPPPAPPAPLTKLFIAQANNRSMNATHGSFNLAWAGANLSILPFHDAPSYLLYVWTHETVSWWIRRSWLTFDTTSLISTAKIQSAYVHVFVTAKNTGLPATSFAVITQGVQHDPVILADWTGQNPITEIGGQADISSFVLNAYNAIPFVPAGFTIVQPGGLTKVCLRTRPDTLNTEPDHLSFHDFQYRSQQLGAGYWPYLEVNYYPA